LAVVFLGAALGFGAGFAAALGFAVSTISELLGVRGGALHRSDICIQGALVNYSTTK
jgi:hypothetical protein